MIDNMKKLKKKVHIIWFGDTNAVGANLEEYFS